VLDGSLLLVWGESQLQPYVFPAHHINLGLAIWHKLTSKVGKETPGSRRPQDNYFLRIYEWDRAVNMLYCNVLVKLRLTRDKIHLTDIPAFMPAIRSRRKVCFKGHC